MDASGVMRRETEASTTPSPGIVMSFAFVVCHVNVVDWPCCSTFGLAAMVAVGAGGAGGGGGVALATFLLQAASRNMPESVVISANIFKFPCVIDRPP